MQYRIYKRWKIYENEKKFDEKWNFPTSTSSRPVEIAGPELSSNSSSMTTLAPTAGTCSPPSSSSPVLSEIEAGFKKDIFWSNKLHVRKAQHLPWLNMVKHKTSNNSNESAHNNERSSHFKRLLILGWRVCASIPKWLENLPLSNSQSNKKEMRTEKAIWQSMKIKNWKNEQCNQKNELKLKFAKIEKIE